MNASRIATAALLAAFCLTPAVAQNPPAPAPAPAPTPAPEPKPQEQEKLQQLKQRMAGRYDTLEKLRDAGKIGEAPDGEVKLVKASHGSESVDPANASKGTIVDLIAAENKDRKELYEALSKDKNLKATAAEIAKQNGLRNLKNAKPDHWIEVKGQWVQRKSVRTEQGDKK
jgi:uncharacterized protein YdbL (DUF1318 family)